MKVLVLGAVLLAAAGCLPSEGVTPGPGEEVNQPPAIHLPRLDKHLGFGSRARIAVEVVDSEGDPVRLRWEQISGPPANLEATDVATLRFDIPPLDEVVPPADGPIGIVPLTRHQAGHYRFRLEATDGTSTSSAIVEARAAAATPGWPRIAQDTATYLDAGRDQPVYAWVVDFQPPRTHPKLFAETTRRPRLLIDAPGRYVIKETMSDQKLILHAGPWMGTKQCGRTECHPVEQRGWAQTKMATVLQRGLDGQLRHDYDPSCLPCHTVGFDPTAKNIGFDDVAEEVGWTFPDRLVPGNYDGLPEKLLDRAGVGCEACHGPGRFFTSYSSEVCAGCHERPPDYVNPAEWRLAPMSKIRDGIVSRPECVRCHTAQGFLDEVMGHEPAEETARVDDVQFELEPITCGACHDAHAGTAERLVRHSGPVFGQDPDVDWGTGMICLSCHHGGTSWAQLSDTLMRPFVPRRQRTRPDEDRLLARRRAPHAPQGQMVRGRAGFALPGPGPIDASPPHLTVPGGCVGCHVRRRPDEGHPGRGKVGGHTFAMFWEVEGRRVENTAACEPCHGKLRSLSRPARSDYDGDGTVEGIYEEVDTLLEMAQASINKGIVRAGISDGERTAAGFKQHDSYIMLVDGDGNLLGTPDDPVTFPIKHERLYKAAYNYLLIKKDRSRGVHNPVTAVRLLQRTVLRMTPQEVPRWQWR